MSERLLLVVIPCLNEEKYIESLVESLAASSLPQRIVIADGGSTDATLAIAGRLTAKYSQVLLMHNPARIQSAGINRAVAAFGDDSEFFIRLDAHAAYPPGYCEKLLEEAEQSTAASVVVQVDTKGEQGFQRAVAAAQNSRLGNGGSAHRLTGGAGMYIDHGHHALMRVDAFRAVGGYDENFTHNEDAELDMRLGKSGYRLWLTGSTRCIYYPRATPLALLRQYIGYGKGRARTLAKHREKPKLRQLAPAAITPVAALALLSPWWPAACLPLALWAFMCIGYGLYLAVKERRLVIALSGPAAMIMHFGWSLGFWQMQLAHYLGGGHEDAS